MSSTSIINTYSISKSYGNESLFSDLSLSFSSDERLGLIGPNGSGKSTLLKILADVETPDAGEIIRKRDTLVVYLPQEDQINPEETIEETLFHAISGGTVEAEHYRRVQAILQQAPFAGINIKQKTGTLSGGGRKRLAIARALIQEPDLLLLDEPTNHLDLEGILWLESLLQQALFSFILISHDRYFLENATNRIIEINKHYAAGFLKVEGTYSDFLQQREALLSRQLQQEQTLANKARREKEWLQRGPKARTSKAQYRLDNAQQIQADLAVIKARNAHHKVAAIDFEATSRKTKKLLEAQNIAMVRGGKRLFSQLNLQLSPGKCVGVLGRNGSGKSTLVHLLKGDLAPNFGRIKWTDNIQIVAFDQKREQLDPELTLKQALCPLGDRVTFQGRSFHVSSWAKRFLFPVEKLAVPISRLSGGEQARVLIANLMVKPADILLLDEPTNDLDIPTLEVLEESLKDFPGAIVLITHDRFLLDRLSHVLLYLDGRGKAAFFADYRQWLKARAFEKRGSLASGAAPKTAGKKAPPRLSHGERKELNRIDKKIAKSEEAVEALQQRLHNPEIMSDSERLTMLYDQIQEAESKVERLYERWQELEALNQNG